MTWDRMHRLIQRFIPQAKVVQPSSSVMFAVMTQGKARYGSSVPRDPSGEAASNDRPYRDLRPVPTLRESAMSERQRLRTSRFLGEIETLLRSAAVELRDNDVEASVASAVRLWWTSRLRGRHGYKAPRPNDGGSWTSIRCRRSTSLSSRLGSTR